MSVRGWVLCVCLWGSAAWAAVVTVTSPERTDLLFSARNELVFHIRVSPAATAVRWELARNMFALPCRQGAADAPEQPYVVRLPTAPLFPGFYDLRVTAETPDGTATTTCTFGYRTDAQACTSNRPDDFRAFWARVKAAVAKIPLDAQAGAWTPMTREEINQYQPAMGGMPAEVDPAGYRTESIEYAKVDFASLGGKRIYAWLAKPPGPGPFPVFLHLPGAGNASRPIPVEPARHGYLVLDIQMHGFAVDCPNAWYPALPVTTATTPEEDPAYAMIGHALQALRYLLARPEADPRQVVAAGRSQGGRLALVVAALDPRVTAAVGGLAHFADQPYQRWARFAAFEMPAQTGMEQAAPPVPPANPETRVAAYYDLLHFAPEIRCPVLMNMGLRDTIAPPGTVNAVFLTLGSTTKELVSDPHLGHEWSADFERATWRWLEARERK